MNMDYESIKEDTVFLGNTEVVKMANITQKQLYEDAILFRSGDHSYKEKWAGELNILVLWDVVWDSVHHFPMTNKKDISFLEEKKRLRLQISHSDKVESGNHISFYP